MRSRALNALAQHATNMQVLLQIYRGTYKCARLTVNLHASCTIRVKYLKYKCMLQKNTYIRMLQ